MRAIEALNDQRRIRGEVLVRRIAHILEGTVQMMGITPETPVDDVRVQFTDRSARVLAQLVEAVQLLEEIIYASDGCVGHRECAHSMEPWQRARALLAGKWKADEPWAQEPWPNPEEPAGAVDPVA